MRRTRLSLISLACVALTTLAGCPTEDEVLTHGVVKLEFRRADNQDSDPFVGTAQVAVTMTYQGCLGTLYEANPDLRQSGREGEKVFGSEEDGGEGWLDRLCEPGLIPAMADCSIVSLEQRLEPIAQLTVTYAITGPLENRRLAFGPLPTKETAGCLDPIVRASVGGTKGYDSNGTVIWDASGIVPLDAVTNQGGDVTIDAERVE